MAFNWPTFPHPGRTDKANSTVTASDAPENDHIEPPYQRKLPCPNPGQYSEVSVRSATDLDTGFHDSIRKPAGKGPRLQPRRRRRAPQTGVRLLRLRTPGP